MRRKRRTGIGTGPVRRYFRHPLLLGGLFALLFLYGGVTDLNRVIFAARTVGVAVGIPVVSGVGIGAGVFAFAVWYVRRWMARKAIHPRLFGMVLLAVMVASAIAYLWTHHRYGDTTLTTPLGVAVVTYGVTLTFAAVPTGFGLLWRAWWTSRSPSAADRG